MGLLLRTASSNVIDRHVHGRRSHWLRHKRAVLRCWCWGWDMPPSLALGRNLFDLGLVDERNLLLNLSILDFEGSRSRPLHIIPEARIQFELLDLQSQVFSMLVLPSESRFMTTTALALSRETGTGESLVGTNPSDLGVA